MSELIPPNSPGAAIGSGKSGPGRPPGVPNKVTTTLRWLVSELVSHNMMRSQMALDQVLLGVKAKRVTRSGDLVDDWIVPPDPKGYMDLQIRLLEFVQPKLQRSEVVTRDGSADVEPIAASATQDEAQRAYLKMVQG